ncbi:MAG: hypothetical protein JWO62_1453 [Acidimicrobiaceae bacterium]|jgi:hypothetical protein|nr:hypothetical protein [Acidimicrobiaceae bacterium]
MSGMSRDSFIGWSADPERPGGVRYWSGRSWTAAGVMDERGRTAHVSLTGWRKFWFERVVRNSAVFHVIAWLTCSVPLVRGDLDWMLLPRELRTLSEARTSIG